MSDDSYNLARIANALERIADRPIVTVTPEHCIVSVAEPDATSDEIRDKLIAAARAIGLDVPEDSE